MLLALALLLAAGGFSPRTVSRLELAWTYHKHAVAPNARAAKIAAFEATPVLAGTLLYVITPFDQVIALDPESGAVRWRYDPHLPDWGGYSEASARGVTVDQGVFFRNAGRAADRSRCREGRSQVGSEDPAGE